jgi:hypothetical protein
MKCGQTNTECNFKTYQDTLEDPLEKEKNLSKEDCFQNKKIYMH